jgi:hypothetical protein
VKEITDHEFIENDKGELALLIGKLSEEEPADPVLLLCPDRNAAFFHRGPTDIYEIAGINTEVLPILYTLDSVLVVEMDGEEIGHAYDAVSGFYEGEESVEAAEPNKIGVTGLDLLS